MNLSGKKVGCFKIIGRGKDVVSGGRKKTTWDCMCKCGAVVTVLQDSLRSGMSTQCRSCASKSAIEKNEKAFKKNQVSHNFDNLLGKRFGKLIVIDGPFKFERKSQIFNKWKVKCSCSSEFELLSSELKIRKACPKCSYSESAKKNPHSFKIGQKPANYKNLIGSSFGKLKVISGPRSKKLRNGKRSNFWIVKCECGNEYEVSSGSLKNRVACRSCSRRRGEDSPRFRGGGLKALYRKQQARALKEREIEWKLSFEDFEKVIVGNCNYCGAAPEIKVRGLDLKINTLDRLDSNGAYELSNIVSSCLVCNKAKGVMNKSEFIKWVKKVASNQE